jgi:hypothetical protein
MAAADYTSVVQQLYISYFGRPADYYGLNAFATQLNNLGAPTTLTGLNAALQGAGNTALKNLVSGSFSNAPESIRLYGTPTTELEVSQFVAAVFENVLHRQPLLAGLNYWVGEIFSGRVSMTTAAVAITNGALLNTTPQGLLDAALINATNAVATDFTASLDTAAEINSFSGPDAAAAARAMLLQVTSTTTVVSFHDTVEDTIDGLAGQLNVGENIALTTGADDIHVTVVDTVDTVKGYFNNTSDNTLSAGDAIVGNGHTVLQVVVDANGTAPFVEGSGIDKLSAVAAGAYSFTVDASGLGTDLDKFALSGSDGATLTVTDIDAAVSVTGSVAAASDSDLDISGAIDGVSFALSLTNDDTDTVGAVATIGSAGFDVVLGRDDVGSVTYSQELTDSAAAVSVGDLSVGGIDLVLGQDASFDISITNYARNTGTGSATVGDLTIGDINMDLGVSASVSLYAYNSATADSGDAIVGNLTVGNVDLQLADGAAVTEFKLYNSADSTKGDATTGNVTLGTIDLVGGDDVVDAFYGYIYNTANAVTSGNATVGDVSVGAITVTVGDDASAPFSLSLENYAYADLGDAVVGNITLDTIDITVGNNAGAAFVYASNYASATDGDATVGTITVGDVNMALGSSSTFSLSLTNDARATAGAAVVGDIVVGNVTQTVGLGGTLNNYISAYANGTSGDMVGNVTVGNIDMYGEPDANLSFSIYEYAANGSIADITVGNVDMKVDGSGSVSFALDAWAKTDVGAVAIGDVTLTLGTSASIDTFSISVTASTGDIASFTIGDVTIVGAKDSYDGDAGMTISAGDDLGDVTIGDLTVTAATNANFNSLSWDFTAGGQIGDITVGDVNLSAAKTGYIWMSQDYAASDDIGNIVYGDVSITASGKDAYAGMSVSADANGNHIGTVTFGDIDLHAKGQSATASFSAFFNDASDTVGLVTVGNIDLLVENTKLATAGAYASVSLDSTGSITVGDISLTAGAATDDFVASATVQADVILNTAHNLTVGNITVVGGTSNSTPTVMDDFGTLGNWLSLTETGSGSITVGNVDYSGYKAVATIDVSGYKGAAVIKAAQKATTITDNAAKNDITLGAGNDVVNMDATTATTTKTDAASLDVIRSFASTKDVLSINGLGSDFSFVSSAAADYATFLTAAGAAMTNFGTDVYARVVGSDVYVAVDADGGAAVDFVVKLAGISSLVSADIAIV